MHFLAILILHDSIVRLIFGVIKVQLFVVLNIQYNHTVYLQIHPYFVFNSGPIVKQKLSVAWMTSYFSVINAEATPGYLTLLNTYVILATVQEIRYIRIS